MHKLLGDYGQDYSFMFRFEPGSTDKFVLVREFVDSAYTLGFFGKLRALQEEAGSAGPAAKR